MKLALRPFKEMDAEQISSWFTDERRTAWWGADNFKYPLTSEQLLNFNYTNQNKPDIWQMCATDENGQLAGHFMIRYDGEGHRAGYLGFIVVNPAIRGKGMGRQMVSLAIKYAFEMLNVDKVSLSVYEDNIAAHKCYLSSGLEDEKYMPEAFSYKDEKWNVIRMSTVRK